MVSSAREVGPDGSRQTRPIRSDSLTCDESEFVEEDTVIRESFLIKAKPSEMKKMTTTRTVRAVRTSVDGGKGTPVSGQERHSTTNSLRDVILGGQDGLVNMLGIALGVVVSGGSTHVLIVMGLVAAITESISMGAVAYTSFGSDRDFYLAERTREQNEIEAQPDEEREEIREIYAKKGFKGQLLEDVVRAITTGPGGGILDCLRTSRCVTSK